MSRPAPRDHGNLQNFMESGFEQNDLLLRPLLHADTQYVYQKEDLVTLRPGREVSWLGESIVRVLNMMYCKPIQVGRSRVLLRREGN